MGCYFWYMNLQKAAKSRKAKNTNEFPIPDFTSIRMENTLLTATWTADQYVDISFSCSGSRALCSQVTSGIGNLSIWILAFRLLTYSCAHEINRTLGQSGSNFWNELASKYTSLNGILTGVHLGEHGKPYGTCERDDVFQRRHICLTLSH